MSSTLTDREVVQQAIDYHSGAAIFLNVYSAGIPAFGLRPAGNGEGLTPAEESSRGLIVHGTGRRRESVNQQNRRRT
ncbi:hypothetical protein [Streptomyces sp. NPDC002550]